MSTTTIEHPAALRAKLRTAGLSEKTELDDATAKALDEAPERASAATLRSIVQGKAPAARRVAVKYPEDVREAYKRALELTGTPEKGGPKYALTVRQADAVKRALGAKGKEALAARDGLAIASDSALLKIAKGKEAPADAVKAVRTFLKAHAALREDRTMYARKGAAILLALREAE